MRTDDRLDRITREPEILGGKPCVRGTRFCVEFILELLGSGASRAEICATYPELSDEDVRQAVAYAARVLRSDDVLHSRVSE